MVDVFIDIVTAFITTTTLFLQKVPHSTDPTSLPQPIPVIPNRHPDNHLLGIPLSFDKCAHFSVVTIECALCFAIICQMECAAEGMWGVQ